MVEDQRYGKRWTFEHINLSLTRPQEGGVAFAVNSTGADGLWSLTATVTPKPRRAAHHRNGHARRFAEGPDAGAARRRRSFLRRRAALRRASAPRSSATARCSLMEGRILAGAGDFGSRDDPESRIHIDEAQLNLALERRRRANCRCRSMSQSGPSRVSFLAQLDVPEEAGRAVDTDDSARPRGVRLRRPLARSAADHRPRRGARAASIRSSACSRSSRPISAAWPAASRCPARSTIRAPDPRLALGVAGTRMTLSAFKRLWPAMVTPRLRSWVVDRVSGGMVERVVIAHQCAALDAGAGRTAAARRRAVDRSRHDRQHAARRRWAARAARCRSGDARAGPHRDGACRQARLSICRRAASSRSRTACSRCRTRIRSPHPTRTRFRAEGTADAAAELLALERLRDSANMALDPATTKGKFAAQVALDYHADRHADARTI